MKKDYGFGLVEVLIAASILSAFLVVFVATFQIFLVHSFDSVDKVQASFLLEEGIESVKFLRDKGYSEHITPLATESPYYLVFIGGTWEATSTEQEYIDGLFERTFIVEDVKRDGADDISDTGVVDPYTKKITVSVSWASRTGTSTESVSTYITNFHEDI